VTGTEKAPYPVGTKISRGNIKSLNRSTTQMRAIPHHNQNLWFNRTKLIASIFGLFRFC
jgi:hypothetical protein